MLMLRGFGRGWEDERGVGRVVDWGGMDGHVVRVSIYL